MFKICFASRSTRENKGRGMTKATTNQMQTCNRTPPSTRRAPPQASRPSDQHRTVDMLPGPGYNATGSSSHSHLHRHQDDPNLKPHTRGRKASRRKTRRWRTAAAAAEGTSPRTPTSVRDRCFSPSTDRDFRSFFSPPPFDGFGVDFSGSASSRVR